MKKLIYVVCGHNASRSQLIGEFLARKYSKDPEIEIKSAGLDVSTWEIGRTLFTEQMAREASLVLASDHDKFYRIRYSLLGNDTNETGKVHLLRIPDIFHSYINSHPASSGLDYSQEMKRIRNEPEFRELIGFIKALSPRGASELTEMLYTRDLYSARQPHKPGQDKKYPFELLYKTLEYRFPEISKLIDRAK